MTHYLDFTDAIAVRDGTLAIKGYQKYGDSCLKRGGTGLFMMLARKWDRIEKICGDTGFDIFKGIAHQSQNDGLLDDIRDLRVYLLIVEAEYQRQQNDTLEGHCETCGELIAGDGELYPGIFCQEQHGGRDE